MGADATETLLTNLLDKVDQSVIVRALLMGQLVLRTLLMGQIF